MADPTDISAENLALRTVRVKVLRKAIYDRLMAFSALSGFAAYNYIGTGTPQDIVAGIEELAAPKALVLAYNDSKYGYIPMADRALSIYVAVLNTKMYVKDFNVDPLDDAIHAVILALDKWAPDGHCRVSVASDTTIEGSQTFSVSEVTVKAQDQ